jgi:predicted ester cyclase
MKKSMVTIFAIGTLAMGGAALAKKQTNQQVIDHFFQVVDAKQFDRLGEVDAPDMVMNMPMGAVKGPEGHAQLIKGFAMAFPNFKHNTGRCIEAGDVISCEGEFTGDHTGPMMTPDGKTIPATQKHVEFPYAGVARIKNGKVAEINVYFDVMGFMQQLGVVPSPPKTASR